MLRASRKKLPTPVIAKSTSWIRAEDDGILRTQVSLGDKVEKGQIIAYIASPLGHSEVAIKAHRSGIVIGQQTLPLVNEGDAIFHLAYFTQDEEKVEQVVDEFIVEVASEEESLTTGAIEIKNP